MKHFYTIITAALVLNNFSYSQEWELKNPYPTGRNIISAYFISPDTGWLGTELGDIIKTTDGCTTFKRTYTDKKYNVYSLNFPTPDSGYAGCSGAVLKTEDGGYTWSEKLNAKNINIYAVWFHNTKSGLAVGSQGRIYRTVDGGNSWDLISSTLNNNDYYIGIFFIDSLTGFISGKISGSSLVIKTVNGGLNWSITNMPEMGNGISFDNNNGILTGATAGQFFFTSDTGLSWQQKQLNSDLSFDNAYIKDSLILLIDKKGLYRSEDLGNTFTYNDYLDTLHSYTLCTFIQNPECIVRGGKDGILLYTSNNITWKRFIPVTLPVTKIVFVDSLYGWASPLVRTTDGGNTWFSQSSNILQPYSHNFTFFNRTTGVMFYNYGTLLKTTDAGSNWNVLTTVSLAGGIRDFVFFDSLNGLIVSQTVDPGGYPQTAYVVFTTDGGYTWGDSTSTTTQGVLKDIYFYNNLGFIASDGDGARTTDRGHTWIPNSFAISNSYYFIDSLNGWAGGEYNFKRTRDGGITYIQYPFSTDQYTQGYTVFYDTSNGYYVDPHINSYKGYLIKTTDGGMKWNIDLNDRSYYSLYASSKKDFWLLGEQGTIRKLKLPENISIVTSAFATEEKINNFKLEQNYPNPFNPSTIINYSVAEAGLVTLKVYDVLGEEVACLVNEIKNQGSYTVKLDASEFSSGVYFYSIKINSTKGNNNFTSTKKMLLLK